MYLYCKSLLEYIQMLRNARRIVLQSAMKTEINPDARHCVIGSMRLIST